LIETGKKFAVVLLKGLGRGLGVHIHGGLDGLEPGSKSGVGLGVFKSALEERVENDEAEEKES